MGKSGNQAIAPTASLVTTPFLLFSVSWKGVLRLEETELSLVSKTDYDDGERILPAFLLAFLQLL